MQLEIGKIFVDICCLRDELKHGGEWEDHKYIVKVPTGISNGKNQYRYFYDMNEYKKYIENLSLDELKDVFAMMDMKKYMPDIDEETEAQISKYVDEATEDERSSIMYTLTDMILKDSPQSKTIADLNKKDRVYTPDEDWQVINEYYNLNVFEHEAYTTNCASCTAAYDLRQRGYDVVASGISDMDDSPSTDELLSWYNNAEYVGYENNETLKEVQHMLDALRNAENIETKFLRKVYETMENEFLNKLCETIENEFLKQGDGARGHFIIEWYPYSGHSIVYEIQNGKVYLKDCQTFEKSSLKDYITEYGKHMSGIGYIRTDNVEVNDNILDRVENRVGIDRNSNSSRTDRGNNRELNVRTNAYRKKR